MAMRVSSSRRRMGVLLWMASVYGCNLQVPQYQALERNLTVDPRERVRDYDACKARALTPADLDSCMKGEGYNFAPVSAQDYQSRECWDDSYNSRFPKAYCYDKAVVTPTPS